MDPFIDSTGESRGLGLLLPAPGFVSDLPTFEENVQVLERAEIEEIAKSGAADKRTVFGAGWRSNQRNKNSCNGYAAAKANAKAIFRRSGVKLALSGAYVYSKINGGRDRGSMLDDGMKAIQEFGCALESTVAWDAIYPGLYPASADEEAKRFRAFECFHTRDVTAFLSGLALGFDGVCAVHVNKTFDRFDDRGVCGGGNGPGNHAVGADGLRWDRGVIVNGDNSWDLWGDGGRMGLDPAKHFEQPIQYHAFYLIRSTSDDPQGENPPEIRNAA